MAMKVLYDVLKKTLSHIHTYNGCVMGYFPSRNILKMHVFLQSYSYTKERVEPITRTVVRHR